MDFRQGATHMSYNLMLNCGCALYVAVNPLTGVAHKRVIETRGPRCRIRQHEVGLQLSPWEAVALAHDSIRSQSQDGRVVSIYRRRN
jgi:hypothetical protein